MWWEKADNVDLPLKFTSLCAMSYFRKMSNCTSTVAFIKHDTCTHLTNILKKHSISCTWIHMFLHSLKHAVSLFAALLLQPLLSLP